MSNFKYQEITCPGIEVEKLSRAETFAYRKNAKFSTNTFAFWRYENKFRGKNFRELYKNYVFAWKNFRDLRNKNSLKLFDFGFFVCFL